VRLYRRAFGLGDTTAALNLAATYQNLGRYRDAVRWFRRALAAGDSSALLELARAELYGIGTRRDVPAAITKLRRVARDIASMSQLEREDAMTTMADALRNGWLVRRDYDEALRWFRRAAHVGSNAAKGMLADLGET
jgi:TPR repeat protein